MPFPFAAVAAAIPAVTSLISGITGKKDDKKVNQMSAEELAIQRMLANRQIDISKYMEELSKKAAGLNGTFTDPYGGGATYNAATDKWETKLSPQQAPIQDASYQEELDRNTHDQQIRREGLQSFELARQRSAGRATDALGDIDAYKRGFGKIDAGRLASSMRGDREKAVNAGYDDAARAAQTVQMRTGNSAITDALTGLARSRIRDTAQIGSPEVEALQIAQGLNDSTQDRLYDVYKGFNDEGRQFYDAQFTPSSYNADAYAKLTDAMKFDLSKLDLALGGSGQAASTIGNAAAGNAAAFQSYLGNRIANPTGKFIQGAGSAIQDLFKLLPGAGGGMSFGG
jgi:hypothetical protein